MCLSSLLFLMVCVRVCVRLQVGYFGVPENRDTLWKGLFYFVLFSMRFVVVVVVVVILCGSPFHVCSWKDGQGTDMGDGHGRGGHPIGIDGTWHGMVCIFIENDFFSVLSILCSPKCPLCPRCMFCFVLFYKNNMCDVCREDALGYFCPLFSNGVCSI